VDFNQIKPSLLEAQQQLDTAKRINKQLEDKLIESKRVQSEMLEAEVARYDK
jgi:F0F1-type ATP synthase membrane subunit b/b'